jgi:ParB-like nuclease domain
MSARPNGRKKLNPEQVQVRDVYTIRPAPENDHIYSAISWDNPDIHDLARSIKEHGMQEPIIVSSDGYIISGHRRRIAAMIAKLVLSASSSMISSFCTLRAFHLVTVAFSGWASQQFGAAPFSAYILCSPQFFAIRKGNGNASSRVWEELIERDYISKASVSRLSCDAKLEQTS